MKLARLRIAGFRGLSDGAFNFARPTTGEPFDQILVTGDSSCGKTSLLEAIIAAKEDVGAYGSRRASASYIRPGARAAQLEATWCLSPGEAHRAQLAAPRVTTTSIFGEGEPTLPTHPDGLRAFFRDYTREANRGKFEFFQAERILPAGRAMRHTPSEAKPMAEARSRLTAAADKYRALRSFLVERVMSSTASLAETLRESGVALRASHADAGAHFQELLRPFLHDKVFDGVEPEGAGYRVRFRTRGGQVIDLDDLSASERQGVLFALTFERHGLNHSVVLIDSPELCVHPSHQAAFLAALCTRGRDNQIIAATTSPEMLSTVRSEQVIDLSRA